MMGMNAIPPLRRLAQDSQAAGMCRKNRQSVSENPTLMITDSLEDSTHDKEVSILLQQ